MDHHPKRKQIRLENYDYSTPGSYFVTICTAKRKKIFWKLVGADIIRPYGIYCSGLCEKMGFKTNWSTYLAEILL